MANREVRLRLLHKSRLWLGYIRFGYAIVRFYLRKSQYSLTVHTSLYGQTGLRTNATKS